MIGERIRDKFAASRKRGMWMGGGPPLGYEVENRRLVAVEREAALCLIFDRFADGSALIVARELNAAGEVTKRRCCATGAAGASRGRRVPSTRCWPTASISARRCTRASPSR